MSKKYSRCDFREPFNYPEKYKNEAQEVIRQKNEWRDELKRKGHDNVFDNHKVNTTDRDSIYRVQEHNKKEYSKGLSEIEKK